VRLTPQYDGPALLSIDGRAADQSVVVARQRRRMEALLAGLSAEQWCAPSRCEGWSVQDVIAHLVSVNQFWASSVVAGLSGTPSRVLAAFDPAAHPPLLIAAMRSLTPAEVLEQFVASNRAFLDALAPLDDDGWSTIAESPAGHVSLRLLAFHALWDSWIHERDIALPLGLDPVEEPDEIESCLQYAAAIGPVLSIGDRDSLAAEAGVLATDPHVGFTLEIRESVVVRPGTPPAHIPCLRGPAVALVEALSVRAPLPADAPFEWRVLVKSLATVFDHEDELEA
jgi:uncharacterized protein (TIGR03083 family)